MITIGPPILSPAPNILINPFCEIDQANEGSSVSLVSGTAVYVVDGWQAAFHSSSAVVTAQRVADGPLTFPNSIKFTVSTGAAVAAGDYLYARQPIEANNLTDLALGNASAQTLSVTFWVKSSIGSYTMSGAIQNFAQTRSYPFNLTVSSSATWTKCTVILPGDVTGTWVTSGTAGGMYLVLTAAAGSTFQGTVNTWAGSNVFGTSSTTNTILSTSSATFQITGVKLEASPIPTPYGRRNFEDELARCQRYYEKSYAPGTAVGSAPGAGSCTYRFGGGILSDILSSISFHLTKRVSPTLTFYDGAGTSGKVTGWNGSAWTNGNSINISAANQNGFYLDVATNSYFNFEFAADARL